MDPPYYNCETDYGKNIFDKSDFQTMASILKSIKGNFILSLNNTPETREIFKGFFIQEVMVRYSVNPTNQKKRKFPELIISSLDLKSSSKKAS